MKPEPSRIGKRKELSIGLIVLAAFGLRLAYLWEIREIGFFVSPVSDAAVYIERGRDFAQGEWLGPADFVHAPLYAYFVGGIMRVAGPTPWWALRIAQCMFGAVACGLLASAGRRWFGERIGLAAGLLLAFCPAAIFFDGLIQKTSLEIFLTALLLACMARCEQHSTVLQLAAIGAVVGLLSLTRQHTSAVIPLVLVWAWRNTPESARRTAGVSACLGALVIVVAPWIARNRVVLGEFVLGTPNLGQNFAMGNGPNATGTYVGLRRGHANGEDEQREWTRAAEQSEGRRLTAREVSDHYLRAGLTWIRQNPAAWLRLSIRKWMMVWKTTEFCDTEDYYLYTEHARLFRGLDAVFHFGVLCPLAAAGLVLTLARWRDLWFLYGWLILNAAATAAFVVFARYRAVLVPVLCLFAGAAIVNLLDLLGRRRRLSRRDLVAIAAGALAAVLANWTVLLPRRAQPMSYCNHATALGAVGRFDEALRESERALSLSPDDVDGHVAAGDALVELHRCPEALEHYRRAAMRDPQYTRVWTGQGNALAIMDRLPESEQAHRTALQIDSSDRVARRGLATAAARQGRLEQAEVMFRKLLADEPRFSEAWLNLGNTYLTMNRMDDAVAAYGRAIDVKPEYADAWYNLGVVESLRGKQDRAIQCFREALRIAPGRTDALDAIRSIRP